MAKLIDLDALGIGKCNPDVFNDKGYAKGWNSAIEILQNAPTVDAVPVVRCGECKHNYGINEPMCDFADRKLREADFCSRGERKGGDE